MYEMMLVTLEQIGWVVAGIICLIVLFVVGCIWAYMTERWRCMARAHYRFEWLQTLKGKGTAEEESNGKERKISI